MSDMNGPSLHLSWWELACHDGTPYPEPWRSSRALPLALEFERIRATAGQAITVLSAYRTPRWNRRVGGARNSQHVEGRALDLRPPQDWTLDRFLRVVRSIVDQPDSLVFGLGRYPTFVHIDIRPAPSGRLIVWQGTRAWAEEKRT